MDLPMGVELANDRVVLDGVHDKLLAFISQLGMVHRLIFGHDLIITSGKDGEHVPGSLHYTGRAVDARTVDKDPEGVALFIHILAFAASSMPLAYFDERNKPGGAHIHLEWLGD